MLHSLVVVDRTHDVVLLVHTYNEVTKDISGQFVEKWCLANLTLAAKLPIDIIEVCDRIKTAAGTKENKSKDTFLEMSSARHFKHRSDASLDFTTRLVSRGGVN